MKHSPFTVIYDACVLYPAPLRDFLIWLALSGHFRARWTTAIHAEWTRNVLESRPDLTADQLTRTVVLMDVSVPDALVVGYEPLIDGLVLPDLNDRHVLAAAIRCSASIIVTLNEKDFPASRLAPFGIEAQHPDAFVEYLFDLDPAAVVKAAQKQRSNLNNPALEVDRFLDILRKQGLVQTMKSLMAFHTIL